MASYYSNLPQKIKDNLTKTAERLQDDAYRGFARQPAEDVAYIILQQAKIDSVPVGEILDKLTYTNPAQLSELISTVLNANRYKSSRLGVRNQRSTKDTVSRNILD